MRFYRLIFFTILTHGLAVFFREGHLFDAELLDTFHLALFKTGAVTLEALPQDFFAQKISWIAPGLYAFVLKSIQGFGIDNPFEVTRALRAFAAIMGILSLCMLFVIHDYFLTTSHGRKRSDILVFTLFTIPLIHTSISSVNLAMFIFICGCYALTFHERGRTARTWFLSCFAGLLWGLAINTDVIIIPLIFLVPYIFTFSSNRNFHRLHLPLIYGSVLLGAWPCRFIDSWGYGTSTWALQNKLAEFSDVVNILETYVRLESVLAYSVLAPLFIVKIMEVLEQSNMIRSFSTGRLFRLVTSGILATNLVLLLFYTTRPAYWPISFYHYLYGSPNPPEQVYTVGIHMRSLPFYQKHDIKILNLRNIQQAETLLIAKTHPQIIFLVRSKDQFTFFSNQQDCRLVESSLPPWWPMQQEWSNLTGDQFWGLYHCKLDEKLIISNQGA